MKASTIFILDTLLCIVVLSPVAGIFWCARRRRRRYRCTPCSVTNWSTWSRCSHDCGNSGIHERTRTVKTHGTCGGCTYPLVDIKGCNTDVCKYPYGDPAGDGCNCRKGWTGKCCQQGNFFLYVNDEGPGCV